MPSVIKKKFHDHGALKFLGKILADFLEDHLESRDRWNEHIYPCFRGRLLIDVERAGEQLNRLDLAPLLTIFINNFYQFQDSKIFSSKAAHSCAHVLRGIRNNMSHQTYHENLSDDERLFRLHVFRRFLFYTSLNQKNDLEVSVFLNELNQEIIDLTYHTLGFESEEDNLQEESNKKTNESEIDIEEGSNLENEEGNRTNFDQYTMQLHSIEEKLDQLLHFHSSPLSSFPDQEELTPHESEDGGTTSTEDPLSYLEAKALLRTLRYKFSNQFPDVAPRHSLLRQTMVDMMLQNKVRTEAEFHQEIPSIMLNDTDPQHLQELPRVLKILERLR